FLDPEIRYGYYRNEMHNLYVQLQQARREMQVQEYTYRSRIHELELELNERTVTGDCYKKAVVVFIMVVFVMFKFGAISFHGILGLCTGYENPSLTLYMSSTELSSPFLELLDLGYWLSQYKLRNDGLAEFVERESD
ncbi:hypothetical protein Tco_1047270, partial [Tanacetum coccineum]